MDWARILAYVTGTVDQELLAQIEYLAAENRILKAQLKGRLKLSDAERATLAEIGHRLGRKVLAEVATVARPDTILTWYRKLVARKFDGSKARRSPGRPRIKVGASRKYSCIKPVGRRWVHARPDFPRYSSISLCMRPNENAVSGRASKPENLITWRTPAALQASTKDPWWPETAAVRLTKRQRTKRAATAKESNG